MISSHTLRWISFTLLVVGCIAGISGFFSTKQVGCMLEGGEPCPAELDQLTQSLNNRSLFLTDFQAEITELTTESVYSLTRVEKQLPNQLNLFFKQDPAVYYVLYKETMHAVAQSGFILSSLQNTNEPASGTTIKVLEEAEDLEAGAIPPSFHEPLLRLAQNLTQANLQPTEISWISPQEIRLRLNDSTVALVDASSPDTAIISLVRILESNEFRLSREENQGEIEIDLRLKLPVLRRAQ